MITLLDKHGKEIQEQDKIMERIEEFYSELYDSDQAVTIQTVPKEVPPIMAWEVLCDVTRAMLEALLLSTVAQWC